MLVARQPRNPAEAKPITTHPLFPAVIVLWFGALFGLGSLAVRPALLEALVIQSRIDLIVAAAAPPLGVTARILVALVLTALGSAVGIVVARRLAQPKPEVHERKRGTMPGHPVEEQPRGRNAYAEPSTCASFDLADETGPDNVSGAGVLAQRRRTLTMEENQDKFVSYDMAPLPGGAPKIFDISRVGLVGASADVPVPVDELPEDFDAPEQPAAAGPSTPATGAGTPRPIEPDLDMTALAGRLITSLTSRRAARNGPAVAARSAPDEAASLGAPEAQPIPPAPEIPQAMRPLDLNDLEENDDDLANLIPPRHMPVPVPPDEKLFEPDPASVQSGPAAEPEAAETEVAEADYASLLRIARGMVPAPSFARINKPDAEAATIEPVVIFPGQMIRQPEASDDSPEFCCDDSLGASEQDAPITADQRDLEAGHVESERALRSALANLQRLSGAA